MLRSTLFSCHPAAHLFKRFNSTKVKGAANAIIDEKIRELAQQLEEEDAYMGPITESQRTSDVAYGSPSHTRPDLDRLRIVPRLMAFYMSNPALEEALRTLRALVDRYTDYPVVKTSQPQWIDPNTIYGETKGGLSEGERNEFYSLLNRLNEIDPQLQPTSLRNILYEMKDKSALQANIGLAGSAEQSVISALLKKSLDQLGRSTTIGRRKQASAKVMMARARYPLEMQPGQIFVNNRSIESYFPSLLQRQEALYPLKVTNTFAKFNIICGVEGGGQTSQASATALAIAKGLCVQNPLLISRLREAGCLQTDARKKERKKPGKAKARKSYGWVKR